MDQQPIIDKQIFNVARKIKSQEARREYLKQVCRDEETHQRILALLETFESEQEFLESPPTEAEQLAIAIKSPGLTEDQIGPYKIREKIGEGGMGVVLCGGADAPRAAQSCDQDYQAGDGYQGSHRSV